MAYIPFTVSTTVAFLRLSAADQARWLAFLTRWEST